jgi:hypothetical protein
LQSEITALLNEKAVHAEHLVAPSPYAFVPESESHLLMAGSINAQVRKKGEVSSSKPWRSEEIVADEARR